jgi:hypothetical protein
MSMRPATTLVIVLLLASIFGAAAFSLFFK